MARPTYCSALIYNNNIQPIDDEESGRLKEEEMEAKIKEVRKKIEAEAKQRLAVQAKRAQEQLETAILKTQEKILSLAQVSKGRLRSTYLFLELF